MSEEKTAKKEEKKDLQRGKKKASKKASKKVRTAKKKVVKKVSKKKVVKKADKKSGKTQAAETDPPQSRAHYLYDGKPPKKKVLGKAQMSYLDPAAVMVVDGFNPRIDFAEIDELAKSVEVHGVRKPIEVVKVGNDYHLVDGERRLRAALKAKAPTIPAIVRTDSPDDRTLLVDALVSNDGHPLLPLEEADAYRRLMDGEGTGKKIKLKELAKMLGKHPAYIRARLALVKAHDSVREAVVTGKIPVTLGQYIAKRGKTAREQEEMVRAATGSKDGKEKVAAKVGAGSTMKQRLKDAVIEKENEMWKQVRLHNKKGKKSKYGPLIDKSLSDLHDAMRDLGKKSRIIRIAMLVGAVYALTNLHGGKSNKPKKGLTARGKQSRKGQ